MKRYFGENGGKGRVHRAGIEYMINNFAGKTLYCEAYEKLLRKLGMFTTTFEDFVLVEFGKHNGRPTVKIIGEI